MRQYTVRGVPPEIEKKIAEEARRKGVSLNRALVSLLERVAGSSGATALREPYGDLDELFGVWVPAEYSRVEKSLRDQREIDKELWPKAG